MDWGLGHYERIAPQLLLAVQDVVDRADPVRGEHVVDVGCGTGNASLLAAKRGPRVTGIDPSGRLLDVAAARAAEHRLEIDFERGEAGALPLPDASADVLISVFGVIFAPNPRDAAAETARVLVPGGRIVLSAWIPEGALWEVQRLRREAVAEFMRRDGTAAGVQAAGAPAFAWDDEHALAALFAPHGFSVELEEKQLSFTASSALDFLKGELRDHPAWVGTVKMLASAEMQSLRARALGIFEDANEDADAFRVMSRYVVATAVSHD
jgi:SAM-dependent methyltransferase